MRTILSRTHTKKRRKGAKRFFLPAYRRYAKNAWREAWEKYGHGRYKSRGQVQAVVLSKLRRRFPQIAPPLKKS